ncbi:MAG: sugar transferase [Lachnospiraceae bacterium]|nr:sugar transferase [Lachnospiraceae bacterium]
MNKHQIKGFYERIIKRVIDILMSLIVIIFLGWLLVIIYIVVRIKLGGPVIFKQERPGKNGKVFQLYKFRTMSNEKDENDNLLPDAQRLNKFGRILRSTSLDELPEFFNILKGDMSIVGPRPLLVKYLEYYNDFEMRRHEVRPGLTGLAQVSGRNQLTWETRFKKDIEYVDNITFFMDVKIVILTIKKIFIREGIEFKSKETIMDYFKKR